MPRSARRRIAVTSYRGQYRIGSGITKCIFFLLQCWDMHLVTPDPDMTGKVIQTRGNEDFLTEGNKANEGSFRGYQMLISSGGDEPWLTGSSSTNNAPCPGPAL